MKRMSPAVIAGSIFWTESPRPSRTIGTATVVVVVARVVVVVAKIVVDTGFEIDEAVDAFVSLDSCPPAMAPIMIRATTTTAPPMAHGSHLREVADESVIAPASGGGGGGSNGPDTGLLGGEGRVGSIDPLS
jgi:hypothetical protein